MLALILDLCNILGGFLLAIGLLALIPNAGDNLVRFAERLGRSAGSSGSPPWSAAATS
jgi:hypothetical protein